MTNPKDRRIFLDCLFHGASSGWLEIAYVHPTATHRARVFEFCPLPLTAEKHNTLAVQVQRGNAAGYNVYFGCTVRRDKKDAYHRGTKADAVAAAFAWCDIDDHDISAARRLLKLPIPPTMIVDSGGGYHGYWLLDTPYALDAHSTPRFERVLKGIALAVQGDVKVAETARIMRLPETTNTKPERNNALCHVIHVIPNRYTYAHLEIEFAPYAPVPQVITRKMDYTPSENTHTPRWIEDYLATGAGHGERNQRLYSVARWYRDNDRSEGQAMSELVSRAVRDGLPEHEAVTTVKSAYNAPKGLPQMSNYTRRDVTARDTVMMNLRTNDFRGHGK